MVEKEKKAKFYDWKKNSFGLYATQFLDQKDAGGPEGEAARYLHVLVSRDHKKLARDLSKDPRQNLVQILKADYDQHKKSLSKLTVGEMLEEISNETNYKDGFAPQILKYSNKTIGDLEEVTEKYIQAMEEYIKAKTPEEAAKAKAKENEHEEIFKVYKSIMKYDMLKIKHYITPELIQTMIKIDQEDNYKPAEEK